MLSTLEGFLSSTDHGRARVLTVGGDFVDIEPDRIVATERLGEHRSGLSLWRVDHTDETATRGAFTDSQLNSLFVAEGHDPHAEDKPDPTEAVHCPASKPIAVCLEKRHGHCL